MEYLSAQRQDAIGALRDAEDQRRAGEKPKDSMESLARAVVHYGGTWNDVGTILGISSEEAQQRYEGGASTTR